MKKAKKQTKLPNVYVHKYVSTNNSYVVALDPGRYCGLVVQAPYLNYQTIYSTLADLGTFTDWWKIAANIHSLLEPYSAFWSSTLTTVIVERQTSTSDTLTMIEAYIVMYFLKYNVNIYSMDRSCVYRYMKQYIPDLKFKRTDLKPKISEYIWNYMLDSNGKYYMAIHSRFHDLADCVAMIRTLVEYNSSMYFNA